MIIQETHTLDELLYRLEHIRRINEQISLFSDESKPADWDGFMLRQLISQKNDLLEKLDHTLQALDLKPVLEELLQTHP